MATISPSITLPIKASVGMQLKEEALYHVYGKTADGNHFAYYSDKDLSNDQQADMFAFVAGRFIDKLRGKGK